MKKQYLVVHTYLSLVETSEKHRPVWRSMVKVYDDFLKAHDAMREAYILALGRGVIASTFAHDSACVEDDNGGKKIWTITTNGGW